MFHGMLYGRLDFLERFPYDGREGDDRHAGKRCGKHVDSANRFSNPPFDEVPSHRGGCDFLGNDNREARRRSHRKKFHGVKRPRPFTLRRASTFLPFFVRIRFRNPWVRARFFFLGR